MGPRRAPTRIPIIAIAFVAVLVPSCVSPTETSPSDAGTSIEQGETTTTATPRTTGVPSMKPMSAADLGIALDPTGRPYDNYWGPQGTTTETRLLSRLWVEGGRLELIDGESLIRPPLVAIDDTVSVRFRGAELLDLRIVWHLTPVDDDRPVESILGVLVAEGGSTVAEWGPFRPAYRTDQGLGAITTRAVIDWAGDNLELGQPLLDSEALTDRPHVVVDRDEELGKDLFLFDNGTGGEQAEHVFTKGFDEDDRMVAIMVWDRRYPWRLAVPTGTPPPDVIEREEELIDCIEGRRLIDKWGRCT